MIRTAGVIFCLWSLLLSAPFAEQLAFKSQHRNGNVILAYQWKDMHHKKYTIQFDLQQKYAAIGNSEFVRFNNQDANNYSYKKVKSYIDSQNIKGLTLKRELKGYNFSYTGPSFNMPRVQSVMEDAKRIQKEAFDEYVKNAFYTDMIDGQPNTLMPDHVRIVQRYVRAMRPVAEGLANSMRGMNHRERINHIMNFLQSIPYDELTRAYDSNGAGFQTPYGLLINNKGDCDTKAVAMLSLLKNFYPNMRMAMIYTTGHAFVGLNMTPREGDTVLTLNGNQYVIADPTGPAMVELGEPDRRASAQLKSGRFYFKELEG